MVLSKWNTSGRCRACSARRMWKRRRDEDAEFAKLVQACKEARGQAVGRLRAFLNEQKSAWEIHLAKEWGTRVMAKLSTQLPEAELERLWCREQHRNRLPDVAIETQGMHTCLAYTNAFDQDFSAEDIKRHFESAVRREHPNLTVQWIDE